MTISINDLEQHLRSQFECKFICDLGEMSTSPTKLFKLLDSAYQESYDNNDRLVFYTSHVPSEEFFRHLYETANFIDISNWFILICGPTQLEQKIISSCSKFSQDQVPFQFYPVELVDTCVFENNFSLPETICAVPWSNLEILQNGNITPCCVSNMTLGNIKNITLQDAFYGNKMQEFRNELLSGGRPTECKNCWQVEDKNLTSIRKHNIKRLKRNFLVNHLDRPTISTLDIKFNNTCNFKCRICSSTSSSMFAAEEHKFLGKPLVVQDNWSESEQFLNQMAHHLPNIYNIDMFGGEPFLIKKFAQVLKLAVDHDYAKNIRLHYNSNGSVWPEQLIDYWKHFKLVDIHFSIDAIGSQFELQRGGRWTDVEENISKIKNYGLDNLSISIMPTISIMNVYYIDQVYDWANEHGFPIFVSHAQGTGLELKYLTRDAKNLIIEKFKHHPWTELQKIVDIIEHLPDNDGHEFQARIKWFDRVRKENFSDSHAEIAKAMGYVYNRDIE